MRKIVFTAYHKAELLECAKPEINKDSVLVKTEYSVISGGTERACLLAMNNTSQQFPMELGYCSVGTVCEKGEAVTNFDIGDRVMVYHGTHAEYNCVNVFDTGRGIYKIKRDDISSLDASLVIIAAMGLGGVRKLECELGESAMVMGQGLLGLFAMQFLRASGAYPVIAVDPDKARQKLALLLGADFALDPIASDFTERVKEITHGKGIKNCVEVTGRAQALKQALSCASFMGKISLLGCTRVSDCNIDFYSEVHKPGIKLIGAHNFVRPQKESYPHHWTNEDDCDAIVDLIASGRIKSKEIISRVCAPEQATEIFNELCDSKAFPVGTVFKWSEK